MGNYLPRTYRAAWDNRDHTARALPGYGGTVLPHNAATKGSVSKHNHPVHNQLPGTIKFQSGPTIVAKYNEYMRGISSDQDIRRIEDIRLPIPKGILESRIIGECGTEYLFETTVYFKVPNYRPLRFAGAYTLL
jgi:hypothetical protein